MNILRSLVLVGAALLLAACEVGPNFLRPAPPAVSGYAKTPLPKQTASADVAGGAAQRFIKGRDIPGAWWKLYRSTALDRLIAEALKSNPNLDAAQAALREAQENVYAGEGALFPTVSVNGSATREQISGASSGLPGFSPRLSVVTASLDISYAPDVFGGTRRAVESLKAQAQYQQFQLEATYLTLMSNVVTAAVTDAEFRGEIAATREIIGIESQQLRLMRHQLTLGATSGAAVLAQEAQLAQTKASLPPLQKQLALTRNQLAALTGRFPSEAGPAAFNLATLHLPQTLPVSLPSKLVRQRPDVRAAEAQLHAASANIGVAIANELPQFSITGSYGSAASSFGSLFSPSAPVWSIGGSVLERLFDGGELLHKRRAAVAAYDQAAALYRGVVLGAFQNVADALRALEFDAKALKSRAAAESAAKASLDIARRQFQIGAIDYLTLLNADRTYEQARINLVQAEANRFADTAALFQALGGGWWNRHDVSPADKGSPDRFALPLPVRTP